MKFDFCQNNRTRNDFHFGVSLANCFVRNEICLCFEEENSFTTTSWSHDYLRDTLNHAIRNSYKARCWMVRP